MESYVADGNCPAVSSADLCSIRRNRGIELGQIVRDTKIALHYLKAIEALEFEKLPGGVYGISYIRQYAHAIGYDPSGLLSLYHSRIPPEPPTPEDGGPDISERGTCKLFGIPLPFAVRWRTVSR